MKIYKIIFAIIFIFSINNIKAQSPKQNNIEELKMEIIDLLSNLESISFKANRYHDGCKLRNIEIENVITYFKTESNEVNSYGYKYFVAKNNNIDTIYFQGDTLIKFENKYLFKIRESAACQCKKRGILVYAVPPQTLEIKLEDLKYKFNESNGMGSSANKNRIDSYTFFLFDNDLSKIKRIAATAQKLRLTLMYNERNADFEKFKLENNTTDNAFKNQPISENQRKFIVQANALAKEKKTYEAITRMNESVKINKFNFPDAYYNLALLSFQYYEASNFELEYCLLDAIFYMKKYLVISPDAEDSRKAQDKIYEWEYKIEN